jgi:hypothetical protein
MLPSAVSSLSRVLFCGYTFTLLAGTVQLCYRLRVGWLRFDFCPGYYFRPPLQSTRSLLKEEPSNVCRGVKRPQREADYSLSPLTETLPRSWLVTSCLLLLQRFVIWSLPWSCSHSQISEAQNAPRFSSRLLAWCIDTVVPDQVVWAVAFVLLSGMPGLNHE